MSPDEVLGRMAVATRRVKETMVAQGTHMDAVLQFWRSDQPVAVVMMAMQWDLLVESAQRCVRGLSPDLLVLTSDAVMSSDAINPSTGEAWERGELTSHAGTEAGRQNPSVVEVLITTAFRQDGEPLAQMQPYAVDGSQVNWLPVPQFPENATLGGRISEAMQEIIRTPTVDAELVVEGIDIQDERNRAMADFAMARSLQRRLRGVGTVALCAQRGTARHRYLEHRMGSDLIDLDDAMQ